MKIIDEREAQKKQQTNKKKPSEMEAKVKEWQLNDFVVGLSYVFSN